MIVQLEGKIHEEIRVISPMCTIYISTMGALVWLGETILDLLQNNDKYIVLFILISLVFSLLLGGRNDCVGS